MKTKKNPLKKVFLGLAALLIAGGLFAAGFVSGRLQPEREGCAVSAV